MISNLLYVQNVQNNWGYVKYLEGMHVIPYIEFMGSNDSGIPWISWIVLDFFLVQVYSILKNSPLQTYSGIFLELRFFD